MPCTLGPAQQVGDFVQGAPVIQGDSIELLLVKRHGQAIVDCVRPAMRFRRAVNSRW